MNTSEDHSRDLLSLVVSQHGALVASGDPFEPFALLDASGQVLAPVAAFFQELQACGRPETTQRSYDFSRDEALAAGERVINMMRMVSLSRGFTKEDEFDVSPRLLEAPTEGAAAGKSIAPYLRGMVDRYYELMGWEVESGHPRQDTIRRLGLEDFGAQLRLETGASA